MKSEIVKHLRKSNKCSSCGTRIGKGKPYATLIGIKGKDGKVRIGFSKVNTNFDSMCKKEGVNQAKSRAINGFSYFCQNIPYIIIKNIPNFVERCQKYFKVNNEDIEIFPYKHGKGRFEISKIKINKDIQII